MMLCLKLDMVEEHWIMSLERVRKWKLTSSVGITPTTSGVGLIVNPLDKVKPIIDIEHTSQREHVSMTTDSLKHRKVSPSS